MVIPTHSRPSAVGIPPVRQPGPSSSRTVVRSGQKSGKGTMKFRTSKCCGDGSSVKPPLADRRITAVGADDQVRRELARPVRAVGLHPDHAVPRPDQVPESPCTSMLTFISSLAGSRRCGSLAMSSKCTQAAASRPASGPSGASRAMTPTSCRRKTSVPRTPRAMPDLPCPRRRRGRGKAEGQAGAPPPFGRDLRHRRVGTTLRGAGLGAAEAEPGRQLRGLPHAADLAGADPPCRGHGSSDSSQAGRAPSTTGRGRPPPAAIDRRIAPGLLLPRPQG